MYQHRRVKLIKALHLLLKLQQGCSDETLASKIAASEV